MVRVLMCTCFEPATRPNACVSDVLANCDTQAVKIYIYIYIYCTI